MSLETYRPPPTLAIVKEDPAHAAGIEALLDRAFGPGRFAKSSERVREFADFAPELSFCALEAGKVVGVVRVWRVNVGDQPVVFLGPLAVDPDARHKGLGSLLVERACDASAAAGEAAIVLVGDLSYFQRMGFEQAADVTMPGPVDARRVLDRRFREVALSGMVRPRA
jgi:predicted N-acetyltransferase YhbS